MHRIRFAQDLALYNLTLSEEIEGFDGAAHVETWNSDPAWQGVREVAEQLTAIDDWAEAIFAANVVFEPLVGELFRSQPGAAGRAGQRRLRDPDRRRRRGVRLRRARPALHEGDVRAADQRQGVRRPQQGSSWRAGCRTGCPQCLAAARELQPLWSQPDAKPPRFEDGLDRAKSRFSGILSDLGLQRPEGADPVSGTSRPRPYATTESAFKSDNTASNRCGVTLMNNQVGAVVAEVMATKDGVTVTPLPSMIRVDADQPDGLRLRRDLRGARRGGGLLRLGRVRGEHVDPLRPDDPRGRPDDHVRQPRGRRRVHRLRPQDLRRSDPARTRSTANPRGGHMYEKDGEKYFIVDSHMHYWDASPAELGARARRTTPRAGSSASTPTRAWGRRRRTGPRSTSRRSPRTT